MEPIGVKLPATPQVPLSSGRGGAEVLPKPASKVDLPKIGGGGEGFDAAAAERARYEAVRQAARDIANIYVVSDRTFTIFKDVTGQYITRYYNLRDGRVTYIPEPELLNLQRSHSGGTSPSLITLNV